MSVDLKKEKRRSIRKKAESRDKIMVEITLPFPKGFRVSKEVVDFSEQGLSFKMTPEEGHFIPGTPFKDVAVLDGHRRHSTSGEVIYAKKVKKDGKSYHRIGIQFVSRPNQRSFLPPSLLPYSLRPKRYEAEEIKNISRLISFTDPEGNTVTGSLINFSKYGAAFELENIDIVLRISYTIDDLRIIIGDEIVYSGKATVVNLQEKDKKFLAGVSLLEAWLDVNKVFNLKRRADVESELGTFISGLSTTEKIDAHFKIVVADLRYFLEGLKKKLDEEEINIRRDNLEHQQTAEKYILETVEKLAHADMSLALTTMNKIVGALSQESQAVYKRYFQQQLQPLWLMAPFVDRSVRKPLGYAGDYEMVNIIFRAAYEGNTLFGKLLNYYCCGLPPAVAHRNRVPYLLRKIDECGASALRDNRGTVKLLSVGCGPAKEIQELVKAKKHGSNLEVTLVDFDIEALYYCQEKILELKALTNNAIKVNFIHKTVLQLIKETAQRKGDSKYDLIYCMGMADYLVLPTCQRLTKALYQSLREGGQLIISNIDVSNEFRYPMEYGCEWYLFYRSKEDLSKFAAGLPKPKKIFVESDATEVNNFLVVQR
jgi:extracellular factor (EF) 3-hydroxypalmitic acid methyl ester biosynthesis protein